MIYKGFEKITHLRQPVIISSNCLITRYLSSLDPPLGMESGKITDGQLNSFVQHGFTLRGFQCSFKPPAHVTISGGHMGLAHATTK